jgi:hypothetical protein
MEIRPVVAELFRAGRTDGRTDRRTSIKELVVDFRSFAKAPEDH